MELVCATLTDKRDIADLPIFSGSKLRVTFISETCSVDGITSTMGPLYRGEVIEKPSTETSFSAG